MFLILTLALLPLGLVALVASLQASRTAELERTALLNVAATESARRLTAEIAADRSALRLVVDSLARGDAAPGICARAEDMLRAHGEGLVRFFIYRRNGSAVCASSEGTPIALPPERRFDTAIATLLPDRKAMIVRTPSDDGRLIAIARYGDTYLGRITEPTTALQSHRIMLEQGRDRLVVGGTLQVSSGRNVESVDAPVDPTDIMLVLTVRDPPVSIARTLSLFLPLLMWFAAAAIGWFVVNRLLIRPLVHLRRLVAAYRPGEVLKPMRRMKTPAQEIRDLGHTFREISQDVANHEAEMEEGLARQRMLTREVHHRVKNNLQIISSLINLHSRSAASPEANSAYATIQRRVDALSVVHRNHYAEVEDNRGLGLRALLGELSASLRSTAPDSASHFTIQLDCAPNLWISQDVAVPVAFLVTELVELAMLIDPQATVRVSVRTCDEPRRAQLRVRSSALRPSEAATRHLDDRFGRVLTGLSRQLRAPLSHDEDAGEYGIDISILG